MGTLNEVFPSKDAVQLRRQPELHSDGIKVGLFGEEGRGWMRMNVATQRSVIERAMEQLYAAWKTLRAEGKAR